MKKEIRLCLFLFFFILLFFPISIVMASDYFSGKCGDSISFIYNNKEVIYGTVEGQNGSCWLDRNLGADRICNSIFDESCYGDLFQWGRNIGVQNRNEIINVVEELSNETSPNHGEFIATFSEPHDWLLKKNDNLWQGVSGINNPCPEGWRIPNIYELINERDSWINDNSDGAFNSLLKFPSAGYRTMGGVMFAEGDKGGVWSSTVEENGTRAKRIFWMTSGSNLDLNDRRAVGYSVRCVADIKSENVEINETNTIEKENIEEANNDYFLSKEKSLIFKIDSNLSERLGGKILLQVETSGEGWYVNPVNNKRYYLGRPTDAFNVMRELGLGISNKDFDSFKGIAPQRLLGRILLKVEDSGKAYYVNPIDLNMHFLGRPSDAFEVMRNLGLGISNNDIRKIDIN